MFVSPSPLTLGTLAMATSSLSSSCWASSTVVLGLGELAVASTCRQRLPLVCCRRGRAGTASPCHDGISRALCKCSPPSAPPLHPTVTAWSWFSSWSLLHALHACCSTLLGLAPCCPCMLLHSPGLALCWPCLP
jgi:hypothetical protein